MVVVQLGPQERAALLRQHLDEGVPLTRLAAHAQVSVRTLQRWAAEYRADSSAAGLQRKARSDRGQRRLPAELIAVIEALALRRPAPTTRFIHRRVCDLAPERGWAPPSYSSVRSVIAAIDPGLQAAETPQVREAAADPAGDNAAGERPAGRPQRAEDQAASAEASGNAVDEYAAPPPAPRRRERRACGDRTGRAGRSAAGRGSGR